MSNPTSNPTSNRDSWTFWQLDLVDLVCPMSNPNHWTIRHDNTASDVYSFGIVAYEMISGYPAFHNIPHDIHLAIKIHRGLRPRIPSHAPELVFELITKCWDELPSKRPTSREIYEIISRWNDEISNDKTTELVTQIKKADEVCENFLVSNASEIHPEAIYTSRKFDILNVSNDDEQSNYQESSESLIVIDHTSQDNVIEIEKNESE
ncbi:1431_t:CDS:2, partial [Racocetra persica]